MLLATACWAAPPTVIQRGQLGPVKTRMTHGDLEKLTGSADLADGTVKSEDIPATTGQESRECTDLWASQPTRHIRVLWGSAQKVDLAILTGQASVYRTGDGITLGTTLRELEKLNGKPFKMSGFGWTYGGRITDWNEGKLQNKLKGIGLGLEFEPLRWTRLPDQGQSLTGDRFLLSSEPELHRLDPHVERIEVDLSAR